MKFKDFRQHFSSARISRYLVATGNRQQRANKLYKANLKVSAAFHPILGVLEVVLRNRLNDILTSHFTDPDWITNQKTGFMIDASLRYTHKRTGQIRTNNFLLSEVVKSEKRIRKRGLAVTSSKIISEQNFGFWTDLFEVHHYRLLLGKPIKIFKTMPPGYGRKEVCDALNTIRMFRNRINHNEPICFGGSHIDFTDATNVYNSLISILTWIDPAIINWIKDLDKVLKTIDSAKKV